ncbi:MAG: DUF7144 family membrane protein [Gaiellaceae bacterium]
MTEYETPSRTPPEEAAGGYVFAGVILIVVGIFHAIAGLVAIIDDDFYVVTANYTFDLDTTAFGWVQLIAGLLVLAAGFALFSAATWARVVGVTFAALSAIANFFFIPYYPFWAILIIALDIWVIWALTRHVEKVQEL